ncbi:MAG: acyl-CoA dehydrogenase family protein [Deltaproteobacteria bacterium]|nr:acyl-CoA dehydrogenase family protein [Deltaproteobacteria bacterium]
MQRTLFAEEHALFRAAFAKFVEREIKPHQERWCDEGMVDRELWRKAGQAGFLCMWVPPEYGGMGADFLYSVIVAEELGKSGESGFAAALHSDIVVPYLMNFGDEAQRQRWLPRCVSGEIVTAIAMTEPGAGSDLAGIRATARRDGDDYVLSGSKTFISNGQLCDLVIVAAKTDPDPAKAHQAISLFVVEAGTPGFVKGKKLKKIGLAAQDTSEMAFDDCRIPAANRLGPEGSGFKSLMKNLAQERLMVAVRCQAAAEQVLSDTLSYVKQREAFGKPIGKLQNTQFVLAECATKVEVGRAFLDRVIAEHARGVEQVKECSMAKLWQSDMLCEVVDACLQLFGGYGYMLEYPVARAFVDARVQKIFAGSNEIMKLIIARQLGL